MCIHTDGNHADTATFPTKTEKHTYMKNVVKKKDYLSKKLIVKLRPHQMTGASQRVSRAVTRAQQNSNKQVLLAWHLIYKHNFSPHRYFIWNNHDICYKNKSLFFPNWFKNNIFLVSQLLNSNGYLLSYSEFLRKYCIPVTPRDFDIVMGAIPIFLHATKPFCFDHQDAVFERNLFHNGH